jgi:hypothetical protein
MIIRNFRAAAWRKEKRKRKKKRKEGQDTKKGPVHQPAHISFLACCLTYLLPVALSWRDGGENWELERKKWEKEEEDSWSAVLNRKNKRKMSSKKVSFHKKLIQDSPIRKSAPTELSSVIKIGNFFCPLTRDPSKVFGSSSAHRAMTEKNSDHPATQAHITDSNDPGVLDVPNDQGAFSSLNPATGRTHSSENRQSDVPVQKIFQKLKSDLRINNNYGSAANLQPPKRPIVGSQLQGDRFNFSPNPTTRLCFNCLSPAHLVKYCEEETRCIYCFNYGHRARTCVKRRFDLRRKWAIKPRSHPSDEAQDGNREVNSTHWSLGPNVQADHLPSPFGSQVKTLRTPSDSLRDQVPAVMVDAASSSVATAILHVNIDKQAVEKNNLVEQVVIQHNKDLTVGCPTLSAMDNSLTTNQDEHVPNVMMINQKETDQNQVPATNDLLVPIMDNNLTEEQRDREQREFIYNFLAAGLKHLGIMGGLAIPNSLIQIDLAALGISSINIVINAPAQKSTLTIADPSSLLQLSQVSDNQQPLPSMQVHPTGPYTRTAPVMRVYFRRKYKGKAKKL